MKAIILIGVLMFGNALKAEVTFEQGTSTPSAPSKGPVVTPNTATIKITKASASNQGCSYRSDDTRAICNYAYNGEWIYIHDKSGVQISSYIIPSEEMSLIKIFLHAASEECPTYATINLTTKRLTKITSACSVL